MSAKPVTREDIVKIAKLSRIKVGDEELDSLTDDFNNILSFVGKIDELDTENVQALHHVLDQSDVYREDVVGKEYPEAVDELSKNSHGHFFKVPRVIE